jgi:hypothetical protein
MFSYHLPQWGIKHLLGEEYEWGDDAQMNAREPRRFFFAWLFRNTMEIFCKHARAPFLVVVDEFVFVGVWHLRALSILGANMREPLSSEVIAGGSSSSSAASRKVAGLRVCYFNRNVQCHTFFSLSIPSREFRVFFSRNCRIGVFDICSEYDF